MSENEWEKQLKLTWNFNTTKKVISFLDNNSIIPNANHRSSYISISSDEEERSSLTNSSVNLDDASDDNVDLSLEIDGMYISFTIFLGSSKHYCTVYRCGFFSPALNLNDNHREKRKSQSSVTDSLHSSVIPETDSEDSLSEIW